MSYLLAILLTSPLPAPKFECGQVICPFTRTGRICVCAPPIISLGSWDPRPLDWSTRDNLSAPSPWGEYTAEKPWSE